MIGIVAFSTLSAASARQLQFSKLPASSQFKLPPCTPGSRGYSYFYLPESQGGGYAKTGAILGVAGAELPDFSRLGLGLSLCSDATVSDTGEVIGDPTEAALVVLAAKMGVDTDTTRRQLPRAAEVPFDSEYKFMATFHDRPEWLGAGVLSEAHFVTVKGAPDIVVARCSHALWHGKQVAMG